MRPGYKAALIVFACAGLAPAAAAQEPAVPEKDRTAPRMERPPPRPPDDFPQIPRDDRRGPPDAEQRADGPPPPRILVEAGKALWPVIQELALGRTDALLRAVAAEDLAFACAPRVAKAQVKTPETAPAAQPSTPPVDSPPKAP